jgi:Tfp pilus assembly protein PilO
MSSVLAKLNLRPQERRLVVFVAIVFFVVLNWWQVWPHFGDWALTKSRFERAQKTYDTYRAEIAKVPGYRVRLRELESAGSSVVPDEQELDLVRTVDNQALMNRLTVLAADAKSKTSMNTQTNRFFEEQYMTLHVTADNDELVNFLVSLTSSNSLIRVKDLTLKTDPSQTKLDGLLTLVASYQRRTPAKITTAPTPSVTSLAQAPKPALATPHARTNKTATAAGSTLTNRLVPARNRQTNLPAKRP